MTDEIKNRFPNRNIGEAADDKPPDLITGMYGCAVVPAMYGQPIKYSNDKWPQPHAEPLTDEQAEGTARGYLNWQGVINVAFRLRGQTIFMDMLDAPDRAHHIFDCVTTTMIQGIKKLHDRQKMAGVDEKFATISNCVVNMISADHYAEHVLAFDLKIRAEFQNFGIHNCAWVVDPYMDAYATVPKLGYIDMGITSDLKKAKRLFPKTRRNILYTSMDLANKSEQQIRTDFEKIANELAPCDVGLPDIEIDVSDDRILFAMDICKEFSDKHGA
jgi:hypothetical protein